MRVSVLDPGDMVGRDVGPKLDRDPAAGRQVEEQDVLRVERGRRRAAAPTGAWAARGTGEEQAEQQGQQESVIRMFLKFPG